jgi:hypothetical protein
MQISVKNLVLFGLAAVGVKTVYDKSPFKLGLTAQGRRGSLQEAMMWEMGGHPSQTHMMRGHANKRR